MKKGISPLIATVLLIGFTIVLAVVVLQWGTTFFQETTEETGCDVDLNMECAALDVEFTAAEYDTDTKTVTLTIYNKANTEIGLGSAISVLDSTESTLNDCTLSLGADISAFETGTATYSATNTECDDATSIKFVPNIATDDADCSGFCTAVTFETNLDQVDSTP